MTSDPLFKMCVGGLGLIYIHHCINNCLDFKLREGSIFEMAIQLPNGHHLQASSLSFNG